MTFLNAALVAKLITRPTFHTCLNIVKSKTPEDSETLATSMEHLSGLDETHAAKGQFLRNLLLLTDSKPASEERGS